jgi:hypothetical protein
MNKGCPISVSLFVWPLHWERVDSFLLIVGGAVVHRKQKRVAQGVCVVYGRAVGPEGHSQTWFLAFFREKLESERECVSRSECGVPGLAALLLLMLRSEVSLQSCFLE